MDTETGESWFRQGRQRVPAREWRAVGAPRQLAYPAARVAAIAVTAIGSFAMHLSGAWFIGSALTHDVLTLTQARWLWVVGLASASFFAGHTGAIGLLDAHSQQRVRLPEGLPETSQDAQRARNPWAVAAQSLGVWGGLAAALGVAFSPRWWPNGVHLMQFAWQFAAASALLSGVVVAQHTGQRFLAEARLAPERRRFSGSFNAYLWQRHALPQGVVNTLLNGLVGVAIAPVALNQSVALVPASFIQRDALGTGLLLTLVIAGGVRAYTRFESRWGVAPVPREPERRTGSLPMLGLLVASSAAALLGLTQVPALSAWTFIVSRAIGCGVWSAIVAYWVACLTVRRAMLIEDAS